MRPLKPFLVILALLWIAAPATAALRIEAGVPDLCLATLRGQIEAGDLATVQGTPLPRPDGDAHLEDGRWRTLCLDSPGGSLVEGLKIARHIVEMGIGTAVADGGECLSACALIFMFGTAYQHESNAVTHRTLHVGGHLGFHQPDLPLDPDRNYSVDDVRRAYDVALEATLQLLVLAARPRPDSPRPFIDSDLLEEMLRHKGQDFFRIDTVGKAGRWGIALDGLRYPKLTEEALLYACQNLTTWPSRRAGDQTGIAAKGYDVFFDRAPWTGSDLESDRIDIEFAGMQTRACAIGIAPHWTGLSLPMICGYDERLNGRVGPEDCRDPDQLWRWEPIAAPALLPSATPLVSLR